MFLEEVPALVDAALFIDALDRRQLLAHIDAAEDQEWLRRQLPDRGLVAFVADGSLLPRASGVSDLPLREG
jgi:predicted ABC-class ATPase